MTQNLKNNNFLKKIYFLVLFLGIGRYYLGPISLLSYFIAAFFSKYNLKFSEWMLCIYLLITFIISGNIYGFGQSFLLFGFHWGFILYYLFFKSNKGNFDKNKTFIFLTTITILEGILVNTFLDPRLLPNYPDILNTHFTIYWQRALSFGGNASVTGVLLVVLMSLLPFSKVRVLYTSIAMIFVGSGSGILALLAYVLKNIYKLTNFINFFVIGIFSSFIYFYVNSFFGKGTFLDKVSPEYTFLLFNQKLERFSDFFGQTNFIELLFGSLKFADAGGDTSYLNFLACHGIIGIYILLIVCKDNICKKNYFQIILFLVFNFHYHIIFSGPGQVIFGYLLAIKNQELKVRK